MKTNKKFRMEFKKFLKNNLREGYIYLNYTNLDRCFNDFLIKLAIKDAETGNECFELSKLQTKSKNSECFYYKAKTVLVDQKCEEYTTYFYL
jgi:hypothetical protein